MRLFKNVSMGFLVMMAATVWAAQEKDLFQKINSQEISKSRSEFGKTIFFVDANNEQTRKKYGSVKGAILLSNFNEFKKEELAGVDTGKKLVFYCANEQCMASHQAANRAAGMGYKNVWVMTDGIMGWVDNHGEVAAK